MKKRIFAVLGLVVILSTLGVTIFAQEPNIISPAVEYLGYWQNRPQNDGYSTHWSSINCPVCGVAGYNLVLYDPEGDRKPLNDGDIIAVVTTEEATRNESQFDIGYVKNVNDLHTPTDHINGRLYYWTIDNKDVIFTVTPKPANTNAPFSWLVCPTTAKGYSEVRAMVDDYVVGNINNYVRGYASAFVVQSFYTDVLVEELTEGLNESLYNEGYQNGYADGQINATENIGAFQLFDDLFEGVTQGLMPVLTFNVYGFTIIGLLTLLVSAFVIMLIVKVIRG